MYEIPQRGYQVPHSGVRNQVVRNLVAPFRTPETVLLFCFGGRRRRIGDRLAGTVVVNGHEKTYEVRLIVSSVPIQARVW